MAARTMSRQGFSVFTGALVLAILSNGSRLTWADAYMVTNLVTDDPSVNPAVITDQNLKNPWGISSTASSPFWVSDNGTGVSTLYSINPATDMPTKVGLEVVIPGSGNVTGQVNNSVISSFNGDSFLFVSEDGTISGWRGALGTNAERFAVSDPLNVYKGTTLAVFGGHAYLYSANFHTGNIDILKDSGAPSPAGSFTDPGLPAGYAPFGIQNLGNTIYVTYALQDAAGRDDVAGAGHGFVTAFDLQGNFLGRVASMGSLNSPWGLAIAPPRSGCSRATCWSVTSVMAGSTSSIRLATTFSDN